MWPKDSLRVPMKLQIMSLDSTPFPRKHIDILLSAAQQQRETDKEN